MSRFRFTYKFLQLAHMQELMVDPMSGYLHRE
jgi:hypothetical protein